MKTCRKCQRTLPLDQFHRNRTKKDGLQPNCKDCQRAMVQQHFVEHKDYYRTKSKVRNREEREKIRGLIEAEKAKHKTCPDCGMERPPCAMQFDHIRGMKDFNIADAPRLSVSAQRLIAEFAKCEVVCAACHAVRTQNRLHAPVAQ